MLYAAYPDATNKGNYTNYIHVRDKHWTVHAHLHFTCALYNTYTYINVTDIYIYGCQGLKLSVVDENHYV